MNFVRPGASASRTEHEHISTYHAHSETCTYAKQSDTNINQIIYNFEYSNAIILFDYFVIKPLHLSLDVNVIDAKIIGSGACLQVI